MCAVDIAGAEGLFPTENFAPVFAKVREYGIPMTIHAGEAAGPDSMKTALSFGTKRIGHGVAAINDPELIRRLIDENVTLEVCVTSNYHTKVVPAIEMHPIHKLLDEGVHVTVNSDNRTCSRTTLQKEKESLKGTARIQRRGDRKDAGICLGGKIPEIKGIRIQKSDRMNEKNSWGFCLLFLCLKNI